MPRLIKRIRMRCPLCDKLHDVELMERSSVCEIKGEEVSYDERYFHCCNSPQDENEFENGSMTNENLMNARNTYRRAHGLLTSDEIVAIRESYGLSQVELARLLGWGEATVSRYESKAIQDETYDHLLRIIKDNPLEALDFLRRNQSKFSNEKRHEIQNRIEEMLETYGKEFLSRQPLKAMYTELVEPCDANGYTPLNIDKTEAAISYIAVNYTALYKVKLMKMLWYADAEYYRRYGRTITGLVYTHEEMGALPVGHYALLNLNRVHVSEFMDGYSDYVTYQIQECKKMDYSILSQDERAVLDIVKSKFRNYNGKQISEYMHEERAYRETGSGEYIPFSLAKEIRPL